MVNRVDSVGSMGASQSCPSSSRASCSSAGGQAGGTDQSSCVKGTQTPRLAQSNNKCRTFLSALSRRKPLDCRTDTHLNRCLNLIDLTALGVGSTLGLGLYVLSGQVASNKAGPAVVVSFALAALASAFSALCYAEFAGRVPRAGSAYAYSYITVGEFIAFIIGWNLILEYVIGASSVARGFSGYICFVYNHVSKSLSQSSSTQLENSLASQTAATTTTAGAIGLLANATTANTTATLVTSQLTNLTSAIIVTVPSSSNSLINSIVNYVTEYFDWPSVAICFVITVFILFGVKESTNVTLAFTAVNLLVVFVVVISSLSSLDLHNWSLTKSEVPQGYGEGGFLPYGWSGVLAGSATCFFGFIGFDTIASSAEEARNPKRNVPLSIILSLFISFIAYMAVAIVQTLIWPYYDQNRVTILPHIFGKLDMPLTYWIVLLGAIAGLTSSQLGGMYPLPRILYSMANDKLIYSCLGHINKRLKLPVRATIVGSIFVAILSCLLDIQDLADMVSIGTLAAYSLVSIAVLILRYEDRSNAVDDSTIMAEHLALTDILSSQQEDDEKEDDGRDKCTKALNVPEGAFAIMRPAIEGKEHLKVIGDYNKATQTQKTQLVGSVQLNAGLKSWLKSTDLQMNPDANLIGARPACETAIDGENNGTILCSNLNRSERKQSLLDLLIVWRADEHDHGRLPDDRSSKQSKLLIVTIIVLTIAIDIVALCLTSGSLDNESQTTESSLVVVVASTKTMPLVGVKKQLLDPKLLLSCSGVILIVVLAAVILMLSRLPTGRSTQRDIFQVPLVPLIPTLSILVNTFLMLNLSYLTWVRFAVWMAFGLFIYFTYGIWNSKGHLLYLNR